MAEGVGFEPTVPTRGTSVFKTDALDHYATPPRRLLNKSKAIISVEVAVH